MEALTHRCYRELPGGQQQRVLLARALCATTRLLFLDEPVAGLDPRVTAAPAPAAAPAPTAAPASAAAEDGIDVDLTALSSTMVYGEVYSMVCEPANYMGKTVKMNGLFATQVYNGMRRGPGFGGAISLRIQITGNPRLRYFPIS